MGTPPAAPGGGRSCGMLADFSFCVLTCIRFSAMRFRMMKNKRKKGGQLHPAPSVSRARAGRRHLETADRPELPAPPAPGTVRTPRCRRAVPRCRARWSVPGHDRCGFRPAARRAPAAWPARRRNTPDHRRRRGFRVPAFRRAPGVPVGGGLAKSAATRIASTGLSPRTGRSDSSIRTRWCAHLQALSARLPSSSSMSSRSNGRRRSGACTSMPSAFS